MISSFRYRSRSSMSGDDGLRQRVCSCRSFITARRMYGGVEMCLWIWDGRVMGDRYVWISAVLCVPMWLMGCG